MSPRRVRHPRRPRGPAGDLAVTLGNAVLVAVPFALFFWAKSSGRAAALREIAPDLPSREVAARLLAQVDRFTGGAGPDDDRTLLVLRVREADPS